METPGRLTRVGLVAALGVVLSVLAAVRLGLEDPWWAAISAWIVSNPDRRQVLAKGVQRVAGTLAGAVAGVLLAGLAAGLPLIQALLLFGVGAFGTWVRFATLRYSFGWFYASITMTLVLVQSLSQPGDLDAYARARCLEILCGVVVATLCELVLGAPPGAAAPATSPRDANLTRLSLVGGLALVLVPLLWALLELPSVVQMSVTALVVLDRDLGGSEVRGVQRILGCAAGGLTGAALLALGLDALPLWVAAFAGGLLPFARLHHGGGPRAYIGTQGGVALIMLMVSGRGPPETLIPGLERLTGVILGTGLVILLALLLAPRPGASAARPAG